MSILQIIMAAYIVGGIATSPFIVRMARNEWDKKFRAGQIPPGTEIIGLAVAQVVSVALWPLTSCLWLVEIATRRLKRQR